MREFYKPILVVSKCLSFDHCRYNGQIIDDDFVKRLKNYVEFRPVCAEVEIGLGIPRDPIRIINSDNSKRLYQPATGRDVTEAMQNFAKFFLDSVGEVDGFILKSRSPSCGTKDVKIYNKANGMAIDKDSGFFGGYILQKFPYLAIEDEGRLLSFRIREHFLTKIYTFANFRKIKSEKAMKALIKFHSENKLMLMAYNQKEMRELGKIVANLEKKTIDDVFFNYENHLNLAFSKIPKYMSNINVLMHGLGYFSKLLSSEERIFFLDSLEKYRAKKVPLSVPINILRSVIIRFNESYLMQQTYFEPYPEELVEITDSGKGRDIET